METLCNILKVFLEQKLIPTVFSVVIAIIALLAVPEDFWMIEKVGRALFFILVAGSVFLVVQLLSAIWKKVHSAIDANRESKIAKEQEQAEAMRRAEDWWYQVDRLNPEEKELVRVFLNNNNTPLESEYAPYFNGALSTYGWILTTQDYCSDEQQQKKAAENVHGNPILNEMEELYPTRYIITKYKLREDVYQSLSALNALFGKISHFD